MKPGVAALAAALAFAACVTVVGAAGASVLTDPVGAPGAPAPPWRVEGLPNQTKPFTRYQVIERDGRRLLEIDANASYGTLVHELPDGTAGQQLSWWWRIEQDNPFTDLHDRSGDDHVAVVCALFDLPIQSVAGVERERQGFGGAVTGRAVAAAGLG
jgi:hypothetical protein